MPRDYPVEITKKKKYSDSTLIEGTFTTPLELHMPGVVPEAAQQAYFQLLLPNKWNNEQHKPICIHLAGTGDHVSIKDAKLIKTRKYIYIWRMNL